MGKTNKALSSSSKGANLREGKRFAANASYAELSAWANTL